MGRPAHKATEENKALVVKLARTGMRQEDIAKVLEIAPHTLRKHYHKEWKEGAVVANGEVIEKLFDMVKNGNTAATIFWAKARCGMHDKGGKRERKTSQAPTIVIRTEEGRRA